jgi:hypothetical protein
MLNSILIGKAPYAAGEDVFVFHPFSSLLSSPIPILNPFKGSYLVRTWTNEIAHLLNV